MQSRPSKTQLSSTVNFLSSHKPDNVFKVRTVNVNGPAPENALEPINTWFMSEPPRTNAPAGDEVSIVYV